MSRGPASKSIFLTMTQLLQPLLVAAVICVAPGCRQNNGSGNDGHMEPDVSADSIRLADGSSLRALSDSCLLVRGTSGDTFTITTAGEETDRIAVSSSSPLFNLLLKLEQRYKRNEAYTYLTPLDIYLNPLTPRESAALMLTKVKNGYVVPAETRMYLWPVINNAPLWVMAATELCRINNDPRWIEQVVSITRAMTAIDRQVSYNPSTGLIGGMPRYMLPALGQLPRWLDATGLFTSASLTVNMAYVIALRNLQTLANDFSLRNVNISLPDMGFDADSLSRAIHRHMWLPGEGMFGGLCYGSGCSYVTLHSADNIGQALAVVSGAVNPAIQSSIIANTPAEGFGMTLFAPTLSHSTASPLPPRLDRMVRTLWCVAASRVNDAGERYDRAFSQLLYAVGSRYARGQEEDTDVGRPMESVVLRAILGASFTIDGTAFTPSVPSQLRDSVIVNGLKIRRARLNVILRGSGNKITGCTLDGAESEPFVPSSLEGEHTLEITLAGHAGESRSKEHIAKTLTPTPAVAWSTPRNATITQQSASGSGAGAVNYIYVNGVVTETTSGGTFTAPHSDNLLSIQVASMQSGSGMSVATAPHVIAPEGAVVRLPFTSIAKGGTRIISDKKTAARFVESNRWKNRVLPFRVTVESDGEYLIDIHYLQGLGIVNSRRRTAVRRLDVNSSPVGILVFPQLSSAAGAGTGNSNEWQSLTSYTNPLRARLHKGENLIELRYWQPSPVFVSPDANVILADSIRLSRIR